MVSPLVKGKFSKTSKGLETIWNWLSATFSFAFYVFINN